MAPAIIVFSHLRWDLAFHRLQHMLLRLAARHPVVFIEEPVLDDARTFLHTHVPAPGILACRPHTPAAHPGFHDGQLPYLRDMVRQVAADYPDHIAWFCTPMALPLLQELRAQRVVYDCMDELAAYSDAPKQLPQREGALLKAADIVLAGGPGLYRSRRERHPNVHCFPGSVDAGYFLRSLDRANSHPAHKDIPGPRLGYFGVLDERIDMTLIARLADAHAQWQIVLAGPLAGIAGDALPRRPNIHHLGPQPYDALPQFLAGWDVCLLPFAVNAATRFLYPPMTLEYMAAELPIVATPLPDVVSLHGGIAAIAGDAPAFIAACEAALLASPQEHAATIDKMRETVASTSWDDTVARIAALLEQAPRAAWEQVIAGDGCDPAACIGRPRRHDAPRTAQTARYKAVST